MKITKLQQLLSEAKAEAERLMCLHSFITDDEIENYFSGENCNTLSHFSYLASLVVARIEGVEWAIKELEEWKKKNDK